MDAVRRFGCIQLIPMLRVGMHCLPLFIGSVNESLFMVFIYQKDAAAWASTYSEDAVQQTTDGIILATGRSSIHSNILERFKEPDLKATVLSRTVHDNVVIDHEMIIRNFPEGLGSVEMLCIYTVESGFIKRAIFKVFNKQLTKLSN